MTFCFLTLFVGASDVISKVSVDTLIRDQGSGLVKFVGLDCSEYIYTPKYANYFFNCWGWGSSRIGAPK